MSKHIHMYSTYLCILYRLTEIGPYTNQCSYILYGHLPGLKSCETANSETGDVMSVFVIACLWRTERVLCWEIYLDPKRPLVVWWVVLLRGKRKRII